MVAHMTAQAVGSAVGINHPSPTPLPTPTTIESPTSLPTANTVSANKANTSNQINTTSNNVIKHDGSRTGPIVDYYSYCDQKTIKVYENERVPFTTKEGNLVYSTKGDIDCYIKNNSAQSPQTTGNTNVPSTASTYIPSSYPPCTIYYPVLHYSQTYNYMSPESCRAAQNSANAGSANEQQHAIDNYNSLKDAAQSVSDFRKQANTPVQLQPYPSPVAPYIAACVNGQHLDSSSHCVNDYSPDLPTGYAPGIKGYSP